MHKTSVELRNFWPDGYTGHTDSSGRDLGKEFLKSLFLTDATSQYADVNVHSHFYRTRNLVKIRKVVSKIEQVIRRDKLVKYKKLHGHLTDNHDLKINSLNIWYTSENIRPPLNQAFDMFLSHDIDIYDGRNTYLPIWATRLGSDIAEAMRAQIHLSTRRNTKIEGKRGICAVISNPEPIRMAFLDELRKHFAVDVYGAFGLPIRDKAEVLSNYKINVCFENDEYPGYVTEKPFEAWINECIPVWRGLDSAGYINQESIINVTELGFQASIAKIGEILENDDE
jgi:hypothetical protein